jgi:phytoene dehydrogenase-like protein
MGLLRLAAPAVEMGMGTSTRRQFIQSASALALMPAVGRAQRLAQAAPESFDYVVAGAGHNSLLCAAYLAKAGNSVLVLEGRAMIGGGVKTAEVLLPGFRQDLCSSVHGGYARNPAYTENEIDLGSFGYELIDPDIVAHYPFLDGASLTVYREDARRTAESIAKVSRNDAAKFLQLAEARDRLRRMPAAQRAGSREGLFFERLGQLSGYDAGRQIWESPHMQAANLTGGHFGGVAGNDLGTGDQATTMIGQLGGRPIPRGGSGMLTVALGRYIEAHDGVVLTSKPVVELLIERGRCTGVACRDGSRYRARKGVVSTIHIKHLIDMAPRDLWGDELLDIVDIWQPEHAMFAFNFALSEQPRYASSEGGTIAPCEAAILERPESIFALNEDQARGELHLDDYPLQIVHCSNVDSTRIPAGYGAVKIEGTMPYALKEGPEHWDVIKEQVADKLLTQYLAHTANLTKDNVLAKVLMSPLDIERMNPAMWRGSVHHRLRTFDNYTPYRLSIPGLYQTGACTEGGGSVTGRPGRAAAAIILEDDGMNFEEVAAKRSRRS